jgi:gamma-glutamylcyclotransferase (GGCT)/AIG2-like uncharacterized protein YtfP
LEVFDSCAGILSGWKLYFFSVNFNKYTEPAFCTVLPQENSEVHGTLALISVEEARKLDQQEQGYNISKLKIQTYENQEIEAEVYTPKDLNSINEGVPSQRYLNLVINGAIESNLKEKYIEKLKKNQYYVASDEIKEKRKKVPKFEEIKEFTIEELRKHNGEKEGYPIMTCSMGYVFEYKPAFSSWVKIVYSK